MRTKQIKIVLPGKVNLSFATIAPNKIVFLHSNYLLAMEALHVLYNEVEIQFSHEKVSGGFNKILQDFLVSL